MFRLLKHTICAAVINFSCFNFEVFLIFLNKKQEHSVSNEILRKIVPVETNILNDPCLKVKVKFRFSGTEFPPFIVFKIYTQLQDGRSSKYINGKNMIKPNSSVLLN